MIGLAKQVQEHRGAIEYDLLTKTGHSIDDIGRSLSWDALDYFLAHLGLDSALARELSPETAAWNTTYKTNMILADIWDVLSMINANIVAMGSKKPAKKPKPYQRPGKKPPDEEKHIGSNGLPPAELRKWINEKRAQYHARNSTGHDYSHARDGGGSAEDN